MATSEKFCLKWNDFQNNISTVFGSLRENTEYADVTLACEDGHQVEAHKIILAASSPLLKNILIRNKHSHPLIFMRGMKSNDLTAIVDFLYHGEANIYEENLDAFLAIAEELKLNGLTGAQGDAKPDSEPYETKVKQNKIHTKFFSSKLFKMNYLYQFRMIQRMNKHPMKEHFQFS